MQKMTKIAIAVVAVVLIVLVGWMIMTKKQADPSAQVTPEPTAAAQDSPAPAPSAALEEPEATAEPEAAAEPEATAEPEAADGAPDEMYEGALAGLTQEEIAAMALAEEEAGKTLGDSGAEGAVD